MQRDKGERTTVGLALAGLTCISSVFGSLFISSSGLKILCSAFVLILYFSSFIG
jgi:hypothetical protein